MDEQIHQPAPLTIGRSLQQGRERLRLSLRQLEAITGIPRATLHHLEHDEIGQPNPRLLHQLAAALELNRDDLFALVGYRPSTDLPSLAPYLRAKYQLSPEALAEAQAALQRVLARHDQRAGPAPPAAETTDDTGIEQANDNRGAN